MDHRNPLRTARLRSAIEFLTTLPLGTTPSAPASAPSALTSAAGALAPAMPSMAEINPTLALTSAAAHDVVLPIRGKDFRHVTSRGDRESALFKRALLRDGVLDGRIFFSRAKCHPSEVFSVIKYDAAKESELVRDRQGGRLVEGVSGGEVERWNRWKGKSFATLLHAEHSPCSCVREGAGLSLGSLAAATGSGGATSMAAVGASLHPASEAYDPSALDDPAIDREKQSFKFASEGVVVSILAFRNERSIKDDINSKFAIAHPWLDWGAGPLSE